MRRPDRHTAGLGPDRRTQEKWEGIGLPWLYQRRIMRFAGRQRMFTVLTFSTKPCAVLPQCRFFGLALAATALKPVASATTTMMTATLTERLPFDWSGV